VQTPAIFQVLAPAQRILVAGAGGGFDVYAGLPLAFTLLSVGKKVFFANLSFSDLRGLHREPWLAEHIAAVGAHPTGIEGYFPERTLATWLAANQFPSTVYAFPKVGVRPLCAAYQILVEQLAIDAIVLVDGGTDILLRGDESGLGTPVEDMTSLAAVHSLTDVPIRLVANVGFGIDAYHGVNHVQVLENIAELDRAGAYLGAFSIAGRSPEGTLYREAVAHAQATTPMWPSIVNGQIAAALAGEHGDVRFTGRTSGSRLFVNPLMALYFTFDLPGLAKRNLYLDRIQDTVSPAQVARHIAQFRREITPRTARAFPH
jgi:hypothetical protein